MDMTIQEILLEKDNIIKRLQEINQVIQSLICAPSNNTNANNVFSNPVTSVTNNISKPSSIFTPLDGFQGPIMVIEDDQAALEKKVQEHIDFE